jgi:hypothetical protein
LNSGTQSEIAKRDAIRYIADRDYKRAALFFRDESFIEFEHSSRDTRWARPSAEGSMADHVCRSLRIFRLNAKHLQLFFNDGSDAEFITNEPHSFRS